MSEKKILIPCQYFYPGYIFSATLPTQLAEDLIASYTNVDAMCGWPYEYSNHEQVPRTEVYHGTRIRRLKYSRFNDKSKIGRIINSLSLFSKFVINILKMLKHDQIPVYPNPPILSLIPDALHRLLKEEYSFVVHDIAPDNAIKADAIRPGSMIDKLICYINKHIYKNAENVIVLGTEMKNYLLNHQISKNPDNTHVIPNWYDMRQLQDNRIYDNTFKVYREQYDKILLCSGNTGQLQDMETLILFLRLNKDQP